MATKPKKVAIIGPDHAVTLQAFQRSLLHPQGGGVEFQDRDPNQDAGRFRSRGLLSM